MRPALLVLLAALPARADVAVLSGPSRAVDGRLSASRDTATLGFEVTPYSVLMAGGDVALLHVRTGGVGLRLGFAGFLELSSDRPLTGSDVKAPFLPAGAGLLWRGADGFSLAASLDELGERLLGRRGILEGSLALRHESDHFTGSADGDEGRFPDVPIVGDVLLPAAAARIPLGPVDLDVALQEKIFVGQRAFVHGPGLDASARWRWRPRIHPFASLFAEQVQGGTTEVDGRSWGVPDRYLVRGLLGAALPGPAGDLLLFASASVGHGKGLLAFREERLLGFGVRMALFAAPGDSPATP